MRSLIVWIIWLLTSPRKLFPSIPFFSADHAAEGMEKEDMDDIEEFLFCLRPYVFAAGQVSGPSILRQIPKLTRLHQFEVTFAPWMLMDLPLDSTNTSHVDPPPTSTNPYIADPTPRSRLIHVTHYGHRRPLCPPVLAHASILNFFARVDRLLGASRFQAAGGLDLTGGMDGPVPEGEAEQDGEAEIQVAENGPEVQGGNQQVAFRPRELHSPRVFLLSGVILTLSHAGPPSRYVAYTPAKRSEIHDTDFKRLTKCYDPNFSSGMAVEDWHGRFAGRWEGSFVSYRHT